MQEDNILTRFITEEGKFRLGEFLKHYEDRENNYKQRIEALEEAIAFFAKWWDETQNPDKKPKVNLLVPDHLRDYKGPQV